VCPRTQPGWSAGGCKTGARARARRAPRKSPPPNARRQRHEAIWVALGILGCAVFSGCQRTSPVEFASSAQVQQLDAPLQAAVRDKLAQYTGTPASVNLLGGSDQRQRELELGQQVYAKYCQQCHGLSGDGNGQAAEFLDPRPRDYRRGVFKFTSTPYGSKPRREDLVRTVTRGIPGTSMPSFGRLPKRQLESVVDYVLALAHRGELEQALALQAEAEGELDDEMAKQLADNVIARWKQAQDDVVEPANKMPPVTAESIAAGAKIFQNRECFKCHGRNGRGGLAGGIEVGKDSWGHPAAAADLTSGMLHGGQSPLDVYRRIYAGINGTPMPSFNEVFANTPDDVWHLTHYVLDLADQRRRGVTIPPASATGTAAPPTAGDPPATQSQAVSPESLP
jgi:mono/diheme cytochrome c family protein